MGILRIPLLLIAACSCLNAAESGPGKAAIAFLEQIREGKVDLAPGKQTAISPHILEQKRLKIANHLKRLGNGLGNGELIVGREKIKGDLAGVLIWKSRGFDPSQMQVIAMGMIKRDGKWLPAPVPASFENSGVGYRAEIREQVRALENWMHQWKVRDLDQLREQSIARMRAGIQQHLKRETLAKMGQREVLERFLDACKRRNAHEIMGLVGGLSEDLPENWPIRANCIESATANPQAPGPWRLLMSANVVRAFVDIDAESGPLQATIACLDPQAIAASSSQKARLELVDIELIRSNDGLWQIWVPDIFWQDPNSRASNNQYVNEKVLKLFVSQVRKQYPALPEASADAGRKALIKALQENDFTKLLKITHIPKEDERGVEAILRAAEIWGSLHELVDGQSPASAHLLLDLDMREQADAAGILVHEFSARKPDRYDPRLLYIHRHKKGWLWTPNPDEQTIKTMEDWSKRSTMEQSERWRDQLLHGCPVVTKLESAAPSEQEAREVVENWIMAIESGDVLTALQQCARLDLEDSSKVVLRNLGYEVVDALRKEGKGAVKHAMSKGPWTGVGTNPRGPQTRSYSMYPVVTTSEGPKILLEIDLIALSGRGREFLNRTSLTRAAELGEKAAEPIAELFDEHCRMCMPGS